jgi:histidinol-phosphate/aromatic aminotransferase/cobyric acid decarboxylase-like protein
MESKQIIKDRIQALKTQSGTHSPSIATILREVPDLKIEVDACFLSNPYATELFLDYLDKDLIKSNRLRPVLEFYPPQNYDVSQYIAKAIQVDPRNLFVGNGAIEAIQAVIHNFVKQKICVVLPTFSSYYEFVKPTQEVVYFNLNKEDNFVLDPEKYIAFVRESKADSIVLINPNNPNGGYLQKDELIHVIESLKDLENLIIDESFIHFAYEDSELSQMSSQELIHKYPNLVIIKSMSKDFGIAGIRAGYALMSESRVKQLLNNGFLWNVSGLADYFFKLYSDPVFQEEYDVVRKKYIMNTMAFLNELNAINGIKVYPSKANFALVELLGEKSSFDFGMDLLVDHGVYLRDCSDKIGLEGKFVRIASRSFEENLRIVKAIKKTI